MRNAKIFNYPDSTASEMVACLLFVMLPAVASGRFLLANFPIIECFVPLLPDG
jgi:hypothetical protein